MGLSGRLTSDDKTLCLSGRTLIKLPKEDIDVLREWFADGGAVRGALTALEEELRDERVPIPGYTSLKEHTGGICMCRKSPRDIVIPLFGIRASV